MVHLERSGARNGSGIILPSRENPLYLPCFPSSSHHVSRNPNLDLIIEPTAAWRASSKLYPLSRRPRSSTTSSSGRGHRSRIVTHERATPSGATEFRLSDRFLFGTGDTR